MPVTVLVDLIAGVLLTLLPERYRCLWLPDWQGSLRRSAVISGALQSLVFLGVLIVGYPRFMQGQIAAIDSHVVSSAAAKSGEGIVSNFEIIFLLAYVFTPLSLILIYFALEGIVRLTAAVSAGEIVGTLPLVAIDMTVSKIKHAREEKRQGRRIPDIVSLPLPEERGYDLAISSCREKPNWNQSMTISYQDCLFEVADYVEAAPPHRHVYLLRRAPEHKVVRGLHQYDPEEVFKDG